MRNRREFLRLGILVSAVPLTGFLNAQSADASNLDAEVYRLAADKIRPLFTKKRPAAPQDWLANHEEPGQTFAQYRGSDPNRPTPHRSKLYLQPIGDFTEMETSMVSKLRDFMCLFFGLEVVLLEKIGMDRIPDSARRLHPESRVTQVLTSHVLDKLLLPDRPRDAVAVLAITPSDLWPGEGWNFVFGQASLGERVGVWSTARFGDPNANPSKYLRRILQVAVHETGHMFGIRHCTAYECCMNGSNNLIESDRAPLYFCAECDPKIWWACKQDPSERAGKLAAIAKRFSLHAEVKHWSRVAEILAK